MDTRRPEAEAVLVRDGRVRVVGTTEQVLAERDADVEVIDLRGKALLPGFIDTHVHLMATGLAGTGLALGDCRSLDEVLTLISAGADQGGFVRAVGFEPEQLAERRYPTRAELDRAAPNAPACVIRRDLHSLAVNTLALARLGPVVDLPGTERDPATGEPTGVLRGEAYAEASLVLGQMVDHATWRVALTDAARRALSVGATTVHALEGGFTGDDRDVEVLLDYIEAGPRPGEPHLKVVFWWQTMAVDKVRARGLPRIGGCILLDGSLGSHTAALSEPYADRPDWRGRLYQDEEKLLTFVATAHAAGMQVALHAIGDRAIEQALAIYAAVLSMRPRADHRHRIEHFVLPTPAQIDRAARLGIHLGMQPTFYQQWGARGDLYWQRVGESRHRRLLPLGTLANKGIVMGGGSDSTVTPLNPLLGIQAAVTREDERQRLCPEAALRLYTADAARLAFEEKEKGTITPGKAADLVVLEANPLAVAPQEIAAIPVVMTLVDGEVQWP